MPVHTPPGAHTVSKGHSRIDRLVIETEPVDPLSKILQTLYHRYAEPLVCRALIDNFGCVLSYEDLAVAAWGDTPEVRRSSYMPSVRRHSIGSYISRINSRFLQRKLPYRIVNIRGVGYRMEDGVQDSLHRYTDEQREAIMRRIDRMREKEPGLSTRAACKRVGVNPKTYWSWRARFITD